MFVYWRSPILELNGTLKATPSELRESNNNHKYFETSLQLVIARFTFLEALAASRLQTDWTTTWVYIVQLVKT